MNYKIISPKLFRFTKNAGSDMEAKEQSAPFYMNKANQVLPMTGAAVAVGGAYWLGAKGVLRLGQAVNIGAASHPSMSVAANVIALGAAAVAAYAIKNLDRNIKQNDLENTKDAVEAHNMRDWSGENENKLFYSTRDVARKGRHNATILGSASVGGIAGAGIGNKLGGSLSPVYRAAATALGGTIGAVTGAVVGKDVAGMADSIDFVRASHHAQKIIEERNARLAQGVDTGRSR